MTGAKTARQAEEAYHDTNAELQTYKRQCCGHHNYPVALKAHTECVLNHVID